MGTLVYVCKMMSENVECFNLLLSLIDGDHYDDILSVRLTNGKIDECTEILLSMTDHLDNEIILRVLMSGQYDMFIRLVDKFGLDSSLKEKCLDYLDGCKGSKIDNIRAFINDN
jgi:hypothetical protein